MVIFSKLRMLRIIAAPNAMKGSLSASDAAASIAKGVEEAFNFFKRTTGKTLPFQVIQKPVADGGDNTVDVIADKFYETPVCGPLYESTVKAKWGSYGKTAIIEMAKASGIALIKPSELDPFHATTYGTGQLISKAIDDGFKNILLTIGGSATVDGGIGAISALGAKFYDKKGNYIKKPFGNSIAGMINKIDLTEIANKCRDIKISIACDVDNPLLGTNGSAAVFGPQKLSPQNRNPANVRRMEENLKHLSEILQKETGKDVANLPGCGAAGGFPLSFCSILNAKIEKGSKLILKLLNFDKLKGSDIVITCEGQCDNQTLHGKGPFEVCNMMKDSYVIMLCGAIESSEVEKGMISAGANIVSSITDGPSTLDNCMIRTKELLQRSSFRYVYSYLSAKYI